LIFGFDYEKKKKKNKITLIIFSGQKGIMNNSRSSKITGCRGQSLIEIVVAMAVFILISFSVMSLALGSFDGLRKGGEETRAYGLAEEAIEAVRSVRDGAWNELINNPAVVAISGNQWVLNSGASELIDGKFTRTILFNDVCRDGSDNIVACPGAYTDPQSKEVNVGVDWSPRPGVTDTVQKNAYVTNWDSKDWMQTNWMGGSGQALWSDASRYDSDDGNVDNTAFGQMTLKTQSVGCGVKSWHFLNGGDYVYNPAKIEVTGSFAQLFNGVSDNPPINPVVSYAVSNINAWTSFQETAVKNGGEIYYQLSDNDGATWQYWNGGAWAVAGACNYNIASDVNTNISSFNIAAKKIMFKAFLSGNGTQQVKLDNLLVGWGEPVPGNNYVTSGYLVSSAYNTTKPSPLQLMAWDGDIASCPATCQIKLQVRAAMDGAGVPGAWTGWYGASGAGSYFTVPRGSLIPNVLNGYQWVQYRAELIGDGTGTPVLQEVRVNYK